MPSPHCQFPHFFQPGGGFPHPDQFLDLTLFMVIPLEGVVDNYILIWEDWAVLLV